MRLCTTLDNLDCVSNTENWKLLADKLQYREQLAKDAIQNMAKTSETSPSMILLGDFFSSQVVNTRVERRNDPRMILEKLMILSNALVDIENHDAKYLVDEEIQVRQATTEIHTDRRIPESATDDNEGNRRVSITSDILRTRSSTTSWISQTCSCFPCRRLYKLFSRNTETSEKDQLIMGRRGKRVDSGYNTGFEVSVEV